METNANIESPFPIDFHEPSVKPSKESSTPSRPFPTGVTAATASDVDVSDLDSDLEPDELVSKYLSTKARIVELEPESINPGARGSSKKKQTPVQLVAKSPAVIKLEQKLKRIENDVLFDQYEADSQWLLRRNQIAQENAQRRRLQLPQPPTPAMSSRTSSAPASSPESESTSETSDDESEDDNAFGDLFASSAEVSVEAPVTTKVTESETNVQIRDFGQFKGISPRRVLEEACRARSVTKVMI